MKVTAKKDMNFKGYGVRFVAGENIVSGKLPYGLRCSMRRHRRVGALEFSDEEFEASKSYTGERKVVPASEAGEEKRVPKVTAPKASKKKTGKSTTKGRKPPEPKLPEPTQTREKGEDEEDAAQKTVEAAKKAKAAASEPAQLAPAPVTVSTSKKKSSSKK